MKPVKYTAEDAEVIDLGTKTIFKYPTPTRAYDIGHMKVNGRFPKDSKTFAFNNICDFFIYVLTGRGKVYAGAEIFGVTKGDVVFIPSKNKYAVHGVFEYITIDVPAFDIKQSKEVE